MIWVINSERFDTQQAQDMLGLIPSFLNEADERPAREQLDACYGHGGGWRPFPGFIVNAATRTLLYKDDPPLHWVAATSLREETIVIYQHAWVMVIQPDNSYEISRMD